MSRMEDLARSMGGTCREEPMEGGNLAVVFGLLSGVYPAWRMSRVHPVVALKGTR